MAKILLVEDDHDLRAALRTTLVTRQHTVTEAGDGDAAQKWVEKEKFDLVISDIQMPNSDGLAFLSWVKQNKPMPVILMTGLAHMFETKKAYELGADDFLTKPISTQEMLKSIDRVLGLSRQEAVSDLDNNYCRVPIEEFITGELTQIGVYLRLSNQKYVRLAHRGDPLPTDRVESYRNKGVAYFFARKEDYAQLVGFKLETRQLARTDSKIKIDKKLNFVRYTVDTILDRAFVNGINRQSFERAAECVETCVSLVSEDDDIFTLLDMLNGHSDWVYAHSLGVSVYSVMMARKMGWGSTPTTFKLSLAGLFHDIGHKEIELAILEKNPSALTKDERQRFENHTYRSREILQGLKDIPHDVVQMVYQHHESCAGGGYPSRLRKDRIHPLARILAVADKFCDFAVKSPRSSGCDASAALEKMQELHIEDFDPAPFEALRGLC